MALLISLDYIYYNTTNRTYLWHTFRKHLANYAFLLNHTLHIAARHRPAAAQTPDSAAIAKP